MRYSSHAKARLRERSISEADVSRTLSYPIQVISVRYGRKAALARLQKGGFLVVIYEEMAEDFIVVTAVKVDKDRVGRYGFTRIR